MSQNLIVNGVTYTYPDTGDTSWGPDATAWAVSVTQNMLQRSGGLFTVSAEVDFGSSFGLKALYYKSRTANIAATGIVRLAVSDKISWRNNANSADLELGVDGSNNLTWQGTPLASIVVADTNSIDLTYVAPNLTADLRLDGSTLTIGAGGVKVTDLGLADAQISLTAAIAYSKLALSNSIVDGDINAAAAIAYSKLALSNSIVNGDIAALAAIAYSKLNLALSIVDGDISTTAAIAYSKLNLALSIVNGDISTTAAIDLSKLAALTIDRALVSNGTGVISVSSVTATELGYVSGVTSGIQGQLGGKANQALDNLAAVAINTSLVSDTANTDDLGTSAIPWRNAYLKTGLVLQETGAGTDAVQVEGPAAITTGYRVAMPDTAPTVAGYALKVKTLGTPNVLEWGEAGGAGGINYIGNNDAEADTTGWATFADAASATPADGTGGSPNVTWTRNTSSPLRNNADFLFTKDAANRQGEGVSYDFTIDAADKAKPIYISFDYLPSANYADDQMSVWIYDVTNALIVQPAPYLVKKVNAADKFAAVFQSASNSTSYRLIVYVGGTSASAYTVQFDNFTVGPSYAVMGSPVTDGQLDTNISLQNCGTTTNRIYSRRVGDKLYVYGDFTVGTPVGGTFGILLGGGRSIDFTKFPSTGGGTICGALVQKTVTSYAIYTNPQRFELFSDGSTAGTIFANYNVASNAMSKVATTAFPLASGDTVTFWFEVPIVGWSSSVLMSDNADTRVVAAKYNGNSGQAISTTATTIICPTKEVDTHGAYNASTGVYTVPVAGTYRVAATVTASGAQSSTTINHWLNLQLYKNGSSNSYMQGYVYSVTGVSVQPLLNGTCLIQCVAGDTLEPRYYRDSGVSAANISTNGSYVYVSFERISGPAQIAATETVACRYRHAGGSIANATNIFTDFSTKDYDSHGAVLGAGSGHNSTYTSTWRYVVPVNGLYQVSATITMASIAWTVGNQFQLQLMKNGTRYSNVDFVTAQSTTTQPIEMKGVDTHHFLAGDIISVAVYQNSGSARNLDGDTQYNFISINRVGNYV